MLVGNDLSTLAFVSADRRLLPTRTPSVGVGRFYIHSINKGPL